MATPRRNTKNPRVLLDVEIAGFRIFISRRVGRKVQKERTRKKVSDAADMVRQTRRNWQKEVAPSKVPGTDGREGTAQRVVTCFEGNVQAPPNARESC